MNRHDDVWSKVELYLPSSPTTYGFESLEDCANSFLDDLESGKRKFKYAIGENGHYDTRSYTKRLYKWFQINL
ncbi:hypothetical protein [Klebsiella pneumoniae]|nr:hypothetical protein [Klebsiella pneumoniae]